MNRLLAIANNERDENNEPVVLKLVRQHNVRNYAAVLM
jgi:hypothetical protein